MDSELQQQRLRRHLSAAREEERGRWARELHDDTLQSLAVLRVQLSSARRAEDVDALRAALDGAVDELGREIANLRALITELRPASLDQFGLEPALGHLLDRTAAAHGLTIEADIVLDDARPGRLHPDVETSVYRVVQEALTNAARHGGARTAEVRVIERHGAIAVTVVDDGRGFDLAVPASGCGLAGMRERVGLVGGCLEVSSSRRGTTVTATLPVRRRRGAPRARKRPLAVSIH